MNRYDTASVAKFSPLSFQELAAAPTMMRQKHDNSIAAAEAMRIKADPLNEHLARAVELKQQMDNEIAKNVDILNKEGYNPTTFQNITKLNRQYQDMISPTGEIGIINAAKIAEAKAKEDFMKNADKSFGQNVLEQKWLEHRQKYANINGRDKDGKIINIDNLGSPKYVDLDTGIRDVLSTLGSTTKEKLLNSGLHFKNTDYGPVMVNAQGSVVTETNDKQLDDALNALKTRFINKTGEGRISRDFEGRTSDEDLAYINSRISAANVYKQNKDYKTNYDMISTGSGLSEESSDIKNFEKIPYGTENTSGSTDLSDRINSIGGKSIGKALSYSYDVLTGNKPQAQTKGEFDKARSQVFLKPEDVLQGGELTIYNNAKKQVSKTIPGFNKLSVTEQNKIIAQKASKDILTFSPIVIKPTVKSVGALIPGVQKGADINSIGNSMLDDAVGGSRNLYDVSTGELISQDDVKSKIKSMTLYGITAPHNLKTQKMIGATSDQKVSPIIATIVDEDGIKRQVYVSRTGTEIKSPEFQKIKSANSVFNGVVNNMNTQVRITDKNSNMYGSKVKYDSSITDGYPIIIISPNGKLERISLDEFQNDAL